MSIHVSEPCEVHDMFFLRDRRGGGVYDRGGGVYDRVSDQTAACAIFCDLCTSINALKRKNKELRLVLKVLNAMCHGND